MWTPPLGLYTGILDDSVDMIAKTASPAGLPVDLRFIFGGYKNTGVMVLMEVVCEHGPRGHLTNQRRWSSTRPMASIQPHMQLERERERNHLRCH